MPGARDPEPLALRVRLGDLGRERGDLRSRQLPRRDPRTRGRHDDLELRLVVEVRSSVARVWVSKAEWGSAVSGW